MQATSIIYRRELGATCGRPSAGSSRRSAARRRILFQAYAMPGEQLSAIVLERFFYFASGVRCSPVILSFRLIAEERQNPLDGAAQYLAGTRHEIVLGKFFAALTFLAVLLALSFYMPLLIKVNGKITFAQMLVGYLGLLLLGARRSRSVFAQRLAKKQLIAALVAAAIACSWSSCTCSRSSSIRRCARSSSRSTSGGSTSRTASCAAS